MKICSLVFLAANILPFWKARETTSDMSLLYTAILMGVRCEACVLWMRMPRKCRIIPIAREEPYLSLIFHSTAEVLSQNRSAWLFYRLDVSHSSASQLRTSPAILILLMVRLPAFNSYFTLCGHYYCKMIGPILFRPDFQTPPVPIPQLSEYPI